MKRDDTTVLPVMQCTLATLLRLENGVLWGSLPSKRGLLFYRPVPSLPDKRLDGLLRLYCLEDRG